VWSLKCLVHSITPRLSCAAPILHLRLSCAVISCFKLLNVVTSTSVSSHLYTAIPRVDTLTTDGHYLIDIDLKLRFFMFVYDLKRLSAASRIPFARTYFTVWHLNIHCLIYRGSISGIHEFQSVSILYSLSFHMRIKKAWRLN
jgi:hypothetical protein